MLFSSANDYKRCKEIVRKKLSQRNICVSDDVLDKITEDVMNITCFAETYVEEEFYKKFLEC